MNSLSFVPSEEDLIEKEKPYVITKKGLRLLRMLGLTESIRNKFRKLSKKLNEEK